ncbi:PREDICTED: uncharacterized protein LOC106788525 isoform X1 [Polistes canadensis]|uniref:uncharacterized protein LOC106788525 isoform X1 n=1 Tax=Polistes canadensis TaxID=91411 RepID=UPI000718FB3C|nr:PREDICTED: uncharacterized protein LOC106788525 isoform X1 [Polistes canadensis]
MQGEQLKGRTSRASSTSSLGREVRCGCQYYQSDSLLPERQARIGRPSSRTGGMQELPTSRLPCSEHEYEPIAVPLGHHPLTTAPVVQIIDTDVVPVADSDDSIDERGLLPSRLILGGDVILPLDGRIEDVAMEGQELGETVGDTSEEQDSPQQIQERLDERYLSSLSSPAAVAISAVSVAPSPPTPTTATTTPGAESRTDGEVNTSQMDSSALDELPLRRDSQTIPQRLKSQAGKLSSRLRGIQRPKFSFTKRPKSEKTRSMTMTTTTSSGKSDKSRTDKKVPSRMDRIRSSFSERPRFSLPDRPKFHFPDSSKFRLPEKAKFSMKRPNISLPKALKRKTRKSSLKEQQQQQQQRSTDSTIGGSRRNIFDFSTYPRIFEKKSKTRRDGDVEGEGDEDDYAATSSPKNSRGQSQESATFPRVRKSYPSTTASWALRFGEPTFDELDQNENVSAIERMRPWRHPSLEEPRRSLMLEEKDTLAARISWEKSQKKDKPRKSGRSMEEEVEEEQEEELEEEEEEIQYMDYDPDSVEISEGRGEINGKEKRRKDDEQQPRVSDWRQSDEEVAAVIGDEMFKPVRRTRSLADPTVPFDVGTSFAAVDPRQFEQIQLPTKKEVKQKEEEEEEVEVEEELEIEEEGYEEEELEEELEELEDRDLSSAHSDREQQQSSGSSCDRRRRGIVEDTGSEEYYPRDTVPEFNKYFQPVNALADDIIMPSIPPKRPARRSLRKRKEDLVEESYDVVVPPARTKRERMVQRTSEDISDDLYYEERSDSSSRHRVVYQTEFDPNELTKPINEPLDDIVVVKPARRKSRSSIRSQSQIPIESDIVSRNIVQNGDVPRQQPPIVPTRRKRARGLKIPNGRNEQLFPATMCNGRNDKWEESLLSSSRIGIEQPIRSQEIHDIIFNAQEDKVLIKNHQHADTPIPVPPKRRSRSRTISLAQDDDRTSHGAESLPEVDYVQEDIPPDETTQDSMRDLSGYALVDKREKPPRPPPPRRRKIREKFATTPRPNPPKRPQRTYSTLTSSTKLKDDLSIEERILEQQQQQSESMPYIEIDLEDRKELRDDRVLSKIQGRPLPAPPRPPRARKEHSQDHYDESLSEIINEATTATQTDPLPDDMIIEEEITQAKLIVTPSLSGSQVMVSTERIPSPSQFPILPGSEFSPNDDDKYRHVDTPRSSREPSSFVDYQERFQERRSPFSGEPPPPPPPPPTIPDTIAIDQSHLQSHLQSIIRSALMTDETLRIGSLEVGDLKVDRLSVSQLETSKLLASEIDAIVISASELKNLQEPKEDSFSPAIIKELIAIRSHLESVASSQAREERRLHDRESDTESILKDSNKKDLIQDQQEIKRYDGKVSITDRSIKSSLDDEKSIKDAKKKIKIESTETESALSFVESMSDNETVDPMSMKRLEMFEGKQLSTQIRHSDSKSSLTAEFDLMSERRPEIDVVDIQDKQVQSKEEDISGISRKSRSRSSSPTTTERTRPVRQTASPIRSLPPVISVTPDTPDTTSTPYNVSNVTQAQHAVISYSEDPEISSDNQEAPRESLQSPTTSNLSSSGVTHFIAFPTSQIPEEFLSLVRSPSTRVVEPELTIRESSRQLLRAIRIVGAKLIRDFASHLVSRVGAEDAAGKIRELELALCALLLVIAILLIVYFSNSRTIMHYHHWDYFNPPQ